MSARKRSPSHLHRCPLRLVRRRARIPTRASLSRASSSNLELKMLTGAPPPYTPANDTWHFLLERYVPPIGLRPLAKRSPLLYGIIETTAGFAFYSMSIYLIGVLTGVLVLPVRHHHTLGDTERLFALYNVRVLPHVVGRALNSWRRRRCPMIACGAWLLAARSGGSVFVTGSPSAFGVSPNNLFDVRSR